ncbi:suppressor of tumorigenicity 14 protein-like [Mya arenaria]|uniref:suppressor of tumorigenicity 14 protein-like n=1 Tax=Mya arenaria TaxID=6604 RepID=UPI0022E24B64|nr:suppressor of tumorigenicity 14 protein-like [Mya arenaria]
MKCLTYLTLFAFLGYAFAIQTYYLDQRCGSTLNFPYYSLDAVRLKLTSNINYRSNMDCLMTVNTTSSKKFMLYFKSIAIESSVSCTRDWLEVFDGPNVNSRYVSGLSYRQCGFSISSQVFKTSGNSLTLRFQSDSSFQYSGFDMVITSYHTGYCYSDEHDCDNGRCISDTLTCNGYNPCGDYSDCPLAGGVIAGIVVGCFFFCVFATLFLIICRRRRLRYHREPTHVQVVANTTPGYGTPGQGYNQPVPQQYGAVPYPQGQQPPTYQ